MVIDGKKKNDNIMNIVEGLKVLVVDGSFLRFIYYAPFAAVHRYLLNKLG